MIPENRRVIDILAELNGIAIVSIIEDGIGHAYIGEEDISNIPCDLLEKKVESALVVMKTGGYYVDLEV